MRNPPPLYEGALTIEMVEDSTNAMEVKITECLWARTFREAGGADIGHARICHPDYTFAEGFNSQVRMIRTKTLMQGHDCCNHRWVVE
jgi:predicted hydrocarbon binding protein